VAVFGHKKGGNLSPPRCKAAGFRWSTTGRNSRHRAAEHLRRHVLQLDAKIIRDDRAAGADGYVIQHGLAAVAEALPRSLLPTASPSPRNARRIAGPGKSSLPSPAWQLRRIELILRSNADGLKVRFRPPSINYAVFHKICAA
jgi:hypothetical protein